MPLSSVVKCANELAEATEGEAWPGNPKWLNVTFRGRGRDHSEFAGAGIYAIFLDERLLYLGIYAGTKGDPYSGSALRDRWLKHVGTITFRGKNLSLRSSAIRSPDGYTAHPLIQELADAGPNILRSQGMEASHRKVVFATENSDLREQPIGEVLKRLTIGYVRADHRPDPRWSIKSVAKRALCEVESKLVRELAPPLNSATPSDALANRQSLDNIMGLIRDRLSAETVGPVAASFFDAEKAKPVMDAAKSDDDELDPMSVFLQYADSGTADVIRALQERCAEENRFILYFTHRGRVARITSSNRRTARNRPQITLEWRGRGDHLLLRSRLGSEELVRCGFQSAKPSSDAQMHSEAVVFPTEITIDKILRACATGSYF